MSNCDRIFYGLLGLVSLAALGLALLGANGYPEVRRLEAECERVSADNEAIEDRWREMDRRVAELKQNHRAVERRAREDLGMVRPGETVILLSPRKGTDAR